MTPALSSTTQFRQAQGSDEHCKKGMKVLVRGRIHYTKWTNNEGIDRYGCEIFAETVDFLSQAKAAQESNEPDGADEIPM
jgi:single-strand DNA-binding protein